MATMNGKMVTGIISGTSLMGIVAVLMFANIGEYTSTYVCPYNNNTIINVQRLSSTNHTAYYFNPSTGKNTSTACPPASGVWVTYDSWCKTNGLECNRPVESIVPIVPIELLGKNVTSIRENDLFVFYYFDGFSGPCGPEYCLALNK